MLFKKLYTSIIFRVILIAITCFAFSFAINKYHDIIININIIALVVIQVVLLIRRLNYMNRDLISFFDSIKYDDSTILITKEFQDQNYFRLSRRLHDVNRQIQKLKTSINSKEQYFKTVTEHASVGLMSYDAEGKINFCNKAAKDIFQVSNINNIKNLDKYYPNISDALISIKTSEQKLLELKLDDTITQNRTIQLTIRATEFKSKTDNFKLISLQDIKNELDDKELVSWQKLVQILRHEIMNSISPISSTIDTLNELITNPKTNSEYTIDDLNNEIISDIASGLKIIKERNTGIQEFIQKFKNISKLPMPKIEQIDISNFINDIQIFWKNDLKKQGIAFDTIIDDKIKYVNADKSQLEQVLINIIKNSIEAIGNTGNGKISLGVSKNVYNKTEIKITDNGKGIPSELIDKIFLPFFTSKEQGSGIGLSLARQIMRLHGGSIFVKSEPEINTTFILTF